jgi:hypothetical protein
MGLNDVDEKHPLIQRAKRDYGSRPGRLTPINRTWASRGNSA